MSVESIAKALHVTGLTPSEKLVLIGIANHDGDGGAWPTIATLARYLGASERSAQRAVAQLVGKGLVSVGLNAGGNERTRKNYRPNLYTLHLPGVTPMSPQNPRGDAGGIAGVTDSAPRGDRAVAPEPSLTVQEPSKTLRDEAFDDFWSKYPTRQGSSKVTARRAFGRVPLKEHSSLMLGLSLWAQFWTESRTESRWIPHASTWLNEKRWENPPAVKATGSHIIEMENGYKRNTIDGSYWHPQHGCWIEDRGWLVKNRAR